MSNNTFIARHFTLSAIILSLLLLFIATLYYPGGSQYNNNAVGYSWQHNYLSNLFGSKAVNGVPNSSQPWAVGGMFFLCISFAVFFIQFSKRIPHKSAANIIKYFGAGATLFAFLAVTPWHDTMITITSTLVLVSIFYIAVFVFKTRLLFAKILCIICLLAFYCCNYIYYTRNYVAILPIVQKTVLFTAITWMLFLLYFTTDNNFQPKQPAGR